MTQRMLFMLGCDLEGGREAEDVTTMSYAVDGVEYEVELCAKHREIFDDLNSRARRTGGKRLPTRHPLARKPRLSREEAKAIRDWARAEGYEIGNNGTIPNRIREAYENREK